MIRRSAIQTFLVTLLCQDRISPRAYRILSTLTGGNAALRLRIRKLDPTCSMMRDLLDLERLQIKLGAARKDAH